MLVIIVESSLALSSNYVRGIDLPDDGSGRHTWLQLRQHFEHMELQGSQAFHNTMDTEQSTIKCHVILKEKNVKQVNRNDTKKELSAANQLFHSWIKAKKINAAMTQNEFWIRLMLRVRYHLYLPVRHLVCHWHMLLITFKCLGASMLWWKRWMAFFGCLSFCFTTLPFLTVLAFSNSNRFSSPRLYRRHGLIYSDLCCHTTAQAQRSWKQASKFKVLSRQWHAFEEHRVRLWRYGLCAFELSPICNTRAASVWVDSGCYLFNEPVSFLM